MRATWNGTVLAESDDTVVVEGNHYFPRSAVAQEYVRESSTRSVCPWKGEASYLTVEVDGERNPDAAWYYPQPGPAAMQIRTTWRSGAASAWSDRTGSSPVLPGRPRSP